MSFVRSNFLISLFALQFLGCSAGNIGYWEFKLLEKSIDTLGTIFKSEKSPVVKKIEVPKAANPPDIVYYIAVSDLDGSEVSSSEIKALTERLRSELLMTKHFKVLERDIMEEILKEQGFQQSGCTTSECVVQIGQLVNVEKMVAGTINKIGNTYSSSVRIIDITTGSIDRIVSFDYTGPIDELLKRGMKKIAIELIL
jgi:hypothetical protein